jgi:hypothetical protein
MSKYRPYGIEPEEQEEPYTKIIPDRVQKLIDVYHSNHIEYPWSAEDRQEQIFEYRRSRKPESYKYDIDSIYRVRDPRDRSKEYYFYQKKGRCLNDNDSIESTNSMTYGYVVEREHELKWNQATRGKEPVRVRDNPVYLLKWNKEEVRKLLEGSEKECLNFYIGSTGTQGQANNPARDLLFVRDQNDFLEGSFEDLAILNKSGMMSPFGSSLHLVERAKKKLENDAFKRIEGSDTDVMELQPQTPEPKQEKKAGK